MPSAGTVSRFSFPSADTSCMATATASMPHARSMRLRPSVVRDLKLTGHGLPAKPVGKVTVISLAPPPEVSVTGPR